MNPILQALGNQQGNPQLNQIRQMMNTIKSARNPQAMMNQMIQSNPQMRNVMNFVNQNGGDAKKAFYALAQQRGINPDDILGMLK